MMEPPRKRRDGEAQLQSLTPLRGIAALWVVLYHYAVIYFPSLHPQTYTQLLGKGYLAVDLFFILSGFVLAHVYREAFTQEVSGNYLKFLFARIARLYPLHLFVLALVLDHGSGLSRGRICIVRHGRADPLGGRSVFERTRRQPVHATGAQGE